MVSPVILILTLSTAFALKAAEGGPKLKFFFYLSLLLLVAGVCLIVVPIIASKLFSGLAM
jgi:archaellum biogenesis protein FlaJ (TadC family)